jgi:hypothetical protein
LFPPTFFSLPAAAAGFEPLIFGLRVKCPAAVLSLVARVLALFNHLVMRRERDCHSREKEQDGMGQTMESIGQDWFSKSHLLLFTNIELK